MVTVNFDMLSFSAQFCTSDHGMSNTSSSFASSSKLVSDVSVSSDIGDEADGVDLSVAPHLYILGEIISTCRRHRLIRLDWGGVENDWTSLNRHS